MNGESFPGPRDPYAGRTTPRGPARLARPESLTVSAVNAMAHAVLEQSVGPLWVQGEVTGWKRHTSGHCYFTLRDRTARLKAVMYRADAQRLPTDPDEGLEVRALGTLGIYERAGEFQLVARTLEGLGAGGLWRIAFEKLRRKLEEEGLLEPERKRPIPRFPAVVGVVTSPVGAALHDILHVIGMRAPWVRVLLSPAKVQGDGAGSDVSRAIRLLARSGLPDVIIVGRGGGSTEDLWAFNEETVARTIVSCPIPVISAVGHEVDITIADLVADWRAPTPSAAAERAVPDGATLRRDLLQSRGRMAAALRRWVGGRRSRLEAASEWLTECAHDRVQRPKERTAHLAARLQALSPLGALGRGYAVPITASGHVLRRVADFAAGQLFSLRVVDGEVPTRVEGPPEPSEPS